MIQILSGRSTNLWEQAALSLSASYHAGRNVVLLVPEQYTLQAERDALDALKVKGFFRLQVLSPSRLASFVFDRAGRDARTPIDERGQALTLARALHTLRGQLQYYGSAQGKPGFAPKLVEAISELKSAGLSPQQLADWLSEQGHTSPRLHDLCLLFAAYEEAMAGQLADKEDKEQEMLARLADSELFAGHDLIVHGFDLLTPPLIRLISLLAQRVDKLLFTLVMDKPTAPDGAAWASVYSSVEQLTQRLSQDGLAWRWDWLSGKINTQPPALAHLQSQLLRAGTTPYAQAPQGLRLYAGKTPHEEVRRVAQLIHEQLSNGVDARQIAVYLADDSYATMVGGVFAAYEIPHFIAVKEPLSAQALVRCLRDALTCVQSAAWRPEDVFSYLKSPYSPLNDSEAWQLENYARAQGIRGKKWTLPFTRGDAEEAQRMEDARLRAISPLMQMRTALVAAKDAQASILAVTHFLEEIGASQRVEAMDSLLDSLGLQEEAQRARQVWDKLMGLFEQMTTLLGPQRVPLNRFALWLEAGLSATHLAALPPQQHSVQVGALGQLMIRQPKQVYILGLNSGTLNVADEGLIVETERSLLSQGLDARMNLSAAQREGIRLLDLWKAIAQAGEGLHLSYALSDDQGQAKAPLTQLVRVKALFPLLIEEGGALDSLREPRPLTPRVALDEIAVLMAGGEMSPPWWSAWAWLRAQPAWASQAEGLLAAIAGDDPRKRLSPEQAGRIYPPGLLSVSRIETYAGCPFRHFVSYGLRLQERKEWALQATDVGTFYHAAMDGFVERASIDPNWAKMSREHSEALMDEVLSDLTRGWEEAPWADTKRARSQARHTLNLCRRMAWSLTEARAVSGFAPERSELRFGLGGGLPPMEIQLADGSLLRLRGTIDRLDMAVLDSGLRCIRIVDYKTGLTQLNGGDLEAGVQLQLMLYLKAALELLIGTVPGGAFYQRLTDPLVTAETEEAADREQRKQLRLQGVMLADAEVIRTMDAANPPISIAKYILADGSLRDSPSLLSQEELQGLMALAQERTRQIAAELFSGLCTRAPLVRSTGRAECEFCSYQGICRTERIGREPLRRRSRTIGLQQLAQESITSD